MKNLPIYRGQIRDQPIKVKPAGQVVREQIKFEDDEDQLKSGCKQEKKKRALNSSMKQPAQRQDHLGANFNGDKLASWLRSKQLRLTLLDRGIRRFEDDEDQLKSGCKQEKKKRALNSSMKQPAQRQDHLGANFNGDKLASWLRSKQLRSHNRCHQIYELVQRTKLVKVKPAQQAEAKFKSRIGQNDKQSDLNTRLYAYYFSVFISISCVVFLE
ncbi:hypothetical protein F511_34064 [Dorcoceras hygrometricum]|uniref:Uncharacterized protein n=1 Tax=Dorcoceras hygrometricum TaxID=472368 RepID=A0A2Z7CTJ3_9LAMI|nr:hypothetical protein F511_34064 [Dorcoceras hygrometricum]